MITARCSGCERCGEWLGIDSSRRVRRCDRSVQRVGAAALGCFDSNDHPLIVAHSSRRTGRSAVATGKGPTTTSQELLWSRGINRQVDARLVRLSSTAATIPRVPSLIQPTVAPGLLSSTVQPSLTAGPILLRPWTDDDVTALVAAYREPEIQRWHGRSMTSQEAEQWIADTRSAWSAETRVSWAVQADGRFAGRMTLKFQLVDGVAAAAYRTRAAARGQGVAPKALAAAVEWAFAVGIHRVELEHSTLNQASCRVASKAGFAPEGTRRHGVLHADGWHDMHVHGTVSDSVHAADGRQ